MERILIQSIKNVFGFQIYSKLKRATLVGRAPKTWRVCRICMTLTRPLLAYQVSNTSLHEGRNRVCFVIPINPMLRAEPGREQSSVIVYWINDDWMIQPRKWVKSLLRWLPILKFSDSYMPLYFSAVYPSSFLTPRVSTTQETWGSSERQGQDKEQIEEWYPRSLEDGSQLCKGLPRLVLPQKFHLATVIALAMGLGGGDAWSAMAGPSSQHILSVLLTWVKKKDCE